MEFPDYHDCDAREKNNDFSLEGLSASNDFSTEILMEELEIVEAEK